MAKKIDENISMGIDVDNDGKPDFHISIKTIAGIVVGIISLAGVWFTLQADIQEAKELPKPEISKMEFDNGHTGGCRRNKRNTPKNGRKVIRFTKK